jgi:hypothetical protein
MRKETNNGTKKGEGKKQTKGTKKGRDRMEEIWCRNELKI